MEDQTMRQAATTRNAAAATTTGKRKSNEAETHGSNGHAATSAVTSAAGSASATAAAAAPPSKSLKTKAASNAGGGGGGGIGGAGAASGENGAASASYPVDESPRCPASGAFHRPGRAPNLSQCPMLRILCRDAAAQVACTHFLEIPDLASLHGACRTWKQWVEHPPTSALESLQRQRLIQAEGVQQFALCSWARLYFTTITIDIDDDERVGDALSGTERMRQRNRALFSCCCFSIAQFPRLKQLHVEVCSIQIHEPSMALAFTALGSSLTYLSFDAWGMDVFSAANSMLRFTPLLKRLETLEMGSIDEGGHGLDLSPLRSMLYLKEVSYGVEANAATHRWTAAQVAALAAIRSLQVLEHSCWSPLLDEAAMMEVGAAHQQQIEGVPASSSAACSSSAMADEGLPSTGSAFLHNSTSSAFDGASQASDEELIHIQPLGSPEQQIQQGIATLVRGQVTRARATAEEVARKRAEAGFPPLPAEPVVPALQKLSLSGTVMSAAVWTHVSQLVGLTSLAPLHWRADIGSMHAATPQGAEVAAAAAGGPACGGWARLSAFRSLAHLDVRPAFAELYTSASASASAAGAAGACVGPIRTEHFLPLVVRLPSLTSLSLGPDLELTRAQLLSMGAGLPGLQALVLRNIGLEDPAALGCLANLQALTLEFCYGIGGQTEGNVAAMPTAAAYASASSSSRSPCSPCVVRELSLRCELPVFPRLSRLVLYDRVRLSESAADELNPRMLSRMPALTLGTLTQNLLAPAEVYAPPHTTNMTAHNKTAHRKQHA